MKSVFITFTIVSLALLAGCTQTPTLHPEQFNYSYQEALIWGQPFPNLEIQIHHSPGREPSQHALDILVDTLYYVTDKETIVITIDPLPDKKPFRDSNQEWDSADIWEVHDEFFSVGEPGIFARNESVYMHILYLNGYSTHSGEERYRGLSLGYVNVLNPDTWKGMANINGEQVLDLPALNPEYSERSVLVHEVGHSLGLVDNGIPMLHERLAKDGSRHSRYPESVMYSGAGPHYHFNSDDPLSPSPYQFDQHDLADLFSFREVGRQLELRGLLPR